MVGTIVNSFAIILGSILGVFINKGIKDEYKDIVMDGVALVVIIIGIMGAIESQNITLVIISIVLGSIIGTALRIENGLDNLGNSLEKKFGKSDSNFSKGFVTGTLVYTSSGYNTISISK